MCGRGSLPVLGRDHFRGLTANTWDRVRITFLALSTVLLEFALLYPHFAWADSPFKIAWDKGRLSVSADNAEVSQVLREVGKQTGIRIRGSQDVGHRVSLHLSDVSLEQGLKAVLDGVDYAVLGDISSPEKARSAQVVIFGWLAPSKGRDAGAGASAPSSGPKPASRNTRGDGKLGVEDEEAIRQDKALAAVQAAAAKGDLDALAKAVESADPAVQAQAFEEMSKLNPQAALEALSNVLKSDQPAQRLQALELLDQSDQADNDTIVSAMSQALNSDDPSLKDYAIQALARRGGTQEMDLLHQAFNDSDPAVRLMVLESVGQDAEALPLLRQAANDPDASVSAAANQLLKAQAQAEAQEQNPANQPQN